jgi:hypothetical protein
LFPLIDELPILIEDLDAAVAAIGDENASARVIAMLCGVSNSPGPDPRLPQALMNLPSFENFMIRFTGTSAT